jgi:hypothetical protein
MTAPTDPRARPIYLQVLDLLLEGAPPNLIRQELGLSSSSTYAEHLNRLRTRGFVTQIADRPLTARRYQTINGEDGWRDNGARWSFVARRQPVGRTMGYEVEFSPESAASILWLLPGRQGVRISERLVRNLLGLRGNKARPLAIALAYETRLEVVLEEPYEPSSGPVTL